MAEDLYKKNNVLYVVGLLTSVIGLALFVFSLYMLPNLLFGLKYDIPGFIVDWREWIVDHYRFTAVASARLLLALMFILSMIFFVIAYFSSNRLDGDLYTPELEEIEKPAKIKESTQEGIGLGLKILLIIVAVFLFGALFEWLIYIPPPQQISGSMQYEPTIQSQTITRN